MHSEKLSSSTSRRFSALPSATHRTEASSSLAQDSPVSAPPTNSENSATRSRSTKPATASEGEHTAFASLATNRQGGGELIGRNHPLWCGYAQNFRLKFSDVFEYGNSPVRFNGHTITFEESRALADAMDPHIERFNHLADSIVDPFEPWTNANSAWLDKTSLADWLASLEVSHRGFKKGSRRRRATTCRR